MLDKKWNRLLRFNPCNKRGSEWMLMDTHSKRPGKYDFDYLDISKEQALKIIKYFEFESDTSVTKIYKRLDQWEKRLLEQLEGINSQIKNLEAHKERILKKLEEGDINL